MSYSPICIPTTYDSWVKNDTLMKKVIATCNVKWHNPHQLDKNNGIAFASRLL